MLLLARQPMKMTDWGRNRLNNLSFDGLPSWERVVREHLRYTLLSMPAFPYCSLETAPIKFTQGTTQPLCYNDILEDEFITGIGWMLEHFPAVYSELSAAILRGEISVVCLEQYEMPEWLLPTMPLPDPQLAMKLAQLP